MNILDKIIDEKRKELVKLKLLHPVQELEARPQFSADRPSFMHALSGPGPCVIAEFKRKSPSKAYFKKDGDVLDIVPDYEKGGAAAVSILTDRHFDGRSEDILSLYGKIKIPVLRKDFIIDEYQVVEARSLGASAILLIAAVLEKKEIEKLSTLARSLGLDILLELHHKEEIRKIPDEIPIIGINNRNLKSFEVNIEQSLELAVELPGEALKVSESGIDSEERVMLLYRSGFQAFLMGERFMKEAEPGRAAAGFIRNLDEIYKKEMRKAG